MTYAVRCPSCFHAWTAHRAISSVRVPSLKAVPAERIRLACNACSCYGQELPAPPRWAGGEPMQRTRPMN